MRHCQYVGDQRRARTSRDYHLGDVSLDMYKEEVKNIMVMMGDALFREFIKEKEFDWDTIEPVRPDSVKAKKPKTKGIGFTLVDISDGHAEVRGEGAPHFLWAPDLGRYARTVEAF